MTHPTTLGCVAAPGARWEASTVREADVDEDLIVEAQGLRKTYDTGSVRVDALQGIELRVAGARW